MDRKRYPYTHHGPTVYGSKLADYLISEHSLIEDGILPGDYKATMRACTTVEAEWPETLRKFGE